MRILLIDDDEDDQVLFLEALAQIAPEITCDVAMNGEQGLRFLNNAETLPEIVFIDINMPIMDGRETLSIIRRSARLNSLYVVIYSTSNAWQDATWFKLKSDDYLIKPSLFEDLVERLSVKLSDYLMGERNRTLIQQTC